MNKKLVNILLIGLMVVSGMMMGCKTPNDDENGGGGGGGGGTTAERVIEEKYRGWYLEVGNANVYDWVHLTETELIEYRRVPSSITRPPIDSQYLFKKSLYYTEGNKLRPVDGKSTVGEFDKIYPDILSFGITGYQLFNNYEK
jgi:hypothetical protein